MSLRPEIESSQQPRSKEQQMYGLLQTAEGDYIAQGFTNFLKEKFDIDAVMGAAYDWRASLEEKELQPIEVEDVDVLEVYVPEDRFACFLSLRVLLGGV